MTRLAGRTALITGAAGGIGSAVARRFVAEGANVVLADVADADPLAAELAPRALPATLDVTQEADWTAAFALAREAFGALDILVNNAGIFRPGRLQATTRGDYEQLIRVNQIGTFLGLRQAANLPAGGAVVNVCSVAGSLGVPDAFGYAATKWAIRGMTKCAALDLAGQKIRVNSVHPGGVDTPMIAGAATGTDMAAIYAGQPIPRVAQPAEIAEVVVFLASNESSYCTGTEVLVDGGLSVG